MNNKNNTTAALQVTTLAAFGRTIQVALGFYLLAVVVLHILQPEWSPRVMPMSAYVIGEGGWLMRLTFLALAAGMLAFPMFLLGPWFLTLAMRKSERWADWHRSLLVWLLLLGLTVVFFIVAAAPAGLAGLAQRLLFGFLFLWLLTVARALIVLAGRSGA